MVLFMLAYIHRCHMALQQNSKGALDCYEGMHAHALQ